MWNFFSTVRHRHSIRKYRTDPVEAEKLHAILEMAAAAPSAGDLQAYHIHALTRPELRLQIADATEGQQFLAEAPIALVFSADAQRSAKQFGERGNRLYAIQDTTIAAAYAQLAAVAAGLASTWVGYFDAERVRRILDIPAHLEPIAILAIGYAADIPEPTPRRPFEELVTYL